MEAAAPSAIRRAASAENEGQIADSIGVPSYSHVLHDHSYARCVMLEGCEAALATRLGQEPDTTEAAAPSAIQQAASAEKEGKIADSMGAPGCGHVQLDFGCDRCAASFIAKLGTVGELVPLTLGSTDLCAFPEEDNRSCDHAAFNP